MNGNENDSVKTSGGQAAGYDAFLAAVERTKRMQQSSMSASSVTKPQAPAAAQYQPSAAGQNAFTAAKKKPTVAHTYTVSSFTAKDLSEKSLDAILSLYGMNIEDIYDLSPGQEWMFSGGKVTSSFFTQSLYRVIVSIKPATFRQNTDSVVAKHGNLRTAFAHTGLDKPYQVVLKNRQAEVRFYDLSDVDADELDDKLRNIMLSDRRRGFDLENDSLLRIAIYKTKGDDTYAVLLSQPHINNDAVSANVLLKELFLDYAMGNVNFNMDQTEETSYADYINFVNSLDKTVELDYWKKVLEDAPEVKPLPGWFESKIEYEQSTKIFTFDQETTKKIRALSKKFKATQNCVVQATWGAMLHHIFGVDDVMFGSITSGRSAEVKNVNMITGGMVNALPVRAKSVGDGKFIDMVKDVQMQFANSMKYCHCSPQEIQRALSREGILFDHLLNFHNFAGNQQFYGNNNLPGITLLAGVGYDNLSTDLCVYFMMTGNGFQINFTYNQSAFSEEKIDLLMECFRNTLLKVCEAPEDVLLSDLYAEGVEKLQEAGADEAMEKAKLVSYLMGIKAFKDLAPEAIREIAEYVRLKSYAEDDIVLYDRKSSDKCAFIVEGTVLLEKKDLHGWYNPLNTVKKGAMVSASGILEDCPNHFEAKVLTPTAKAVVIAKEEMQALIGKYPQIAINIIEELDGMARKYSSLWICQ